VFYTTIMDVKTRYKVRRVVSLGTPSYQLGHYEMTRKPGSRRSVFKVLVHLGERVAPEAALKVWREDVERAQAAGRDKTVARLEEKIRKLEGTINGEAQQCRRRATGLPSARTDCSRVCTRPRPRTAPSASTSTVGRKKTWKGSSPRRGATRPAGSSLAARRSEDEGGLDLGPLLGHSRSDSPPQPRDQLIVRRCRVVGVDMRKAGTVGELVDRHSLRLRGLAPLLHIGSPFLHTTRAVSKARDASDLF
jgi:hypothetical protein